MNHHEEIRSILIEILRIGLLRIRELGAAGLAEACSMEADHLHNIPRIIETMDLVEVYNYYNVERPGFQAATKFGIASFELLWKRLWVILEESRVKEDDAISD